MNVDAEFPHDACLHQRMDPRLRSGIFLLGNGHHFQVFDFHDFLKLGVAKSGKF